MLRILLIVIALALVVVLVRAATRPSTFRVSRSLRIKAAPERIFPLISDLQAFGTWSPYERKDPAMKRRFSGAPSGPGSVYEFDGNNQVGSGRLSITESTPSSHVTIALDMLKPIAAHNVVEFSLEPQGDATNVIWTMTGCSGFVGKLMGVIFNMDRMIGADFEAGLTSLRAMVESRNTTPLLETQKESANG